MTLAADAGTVSGLLAFAAEATLIIGGALFLIFHRRDK